MVDTLTVIHEGLSIATGLGTMALAYLHFRVKKQSAEQKDNIAGLEEIQNIKLKLAVLEERLSSEIHLLDRLDDKLSDLERELK